jgi:CubicO group peptidase (beta-lactamase class C family)
MDAKSKISTYLLILLVLFSYSSAYAIGSPSKRFTRWLNREMDKHQVPGVSIAVIREYKVDWVAGFGVANILSEKEIKDSTLFQAGSISKPVTAVATLKAAEDGRVDLDIDINNILKTWQVPRSSYFHSEFITLRELLSHSSGVNVPGFLGYRRGAKIPSLVQVLRGESPANNLPLRINGSPGETIQYSGGGYAIIQQALEDKYQEPFTKITERIIFKPLGMTSSTFDEPLPDRLVPSIAAPYYPKYTSVPGGPHTYIAAAAAGLWTTPIDLAKLTISIMRSLKGSPYQILSPESARLLVEPQMEDMGLGFISKVNKYGQSTRHGRFFMHQGQTEGYRSILIARTKGGFGAIIMTNMSPPGQDIMDGKVKDDWGFIFSIVHRIADEEDWY